MCEHLTVTDVCGWQVFFFLKLLLFYEGWQTPRVTVERSIMASEYKHLPNVRMKYKQVHENTTSYFSVKFWEISL